MFTSTKLDNTALQQTVAAIEKLLVNQTVGGVIRYENDNYMKLDSESPSNPWFVCTMWLAQYYVQQNQVDKAKDLVRWSMSHSLGSGVLSEQVNPNTGYAIGVAPLVWSHAEIINTVLFFIVIIEKFSLARIPSYFTFTKGILPSGFPCFFITKPLIGFSGLYFTIRRIIGLPPVIWLKLLGGIVEYKGCC